MARRIYDGEIRVYWVPGLATITNTSAPTTTQITTTGVDVTPFMASLDTPLEGEAAPSPDLSSAFDKTVAGTFGGSITSEMYREDLVADDDAWPLFIRNATGYLVVRRFGGSTVAIAASQVVEVWAVRVITRSPAAAERGAVQTFNVSFAALNEPVLDAVVA